MNFGAVDGKCALTEWNDLHPAKLTLNSLIAETHCPLLSQHHLPVCIKFDQDKKQDRKGEQEDPP